jgi:peptidoglycan endopeptidase LytF
MKRRDTIIIAVLVNAGLLLVLFATAMRSNKKDETKELSKMSIVKEEPMQVPSLQDNHAEQLAALNTVDPLALALNEGEGALGLGDEMDIPLAPQETVPAAPVPTATPTPSPTSEPVATPSSKSESTNVTVKVKKGDALEKIARAHHTTVKAIMAANNLSNANLKIGQVLKIPSSDGTVAKKEGAKSTSTANEYYTVKEGDNPWLIASRNHVKLDDILKLNGMDEAKAKRLKPGDRLRIR